MSYYQLLLQLDLYFLLLDDFMHLLFDPLFGVSLFFVSIESIDFCRQVEEGLVDELLLQQLILELSATHQEPL